MRRSLKSRFGIKEKEHIHEWQGNAQKKGAKRGMRQNPGVFLLYQESQVDRFLVESPSSGGGTPPNGRKRKTQGENKGHFLHESRIKSTLYLRGRSKPKHMRVQNWMGS